MLRIVAIFLAVLLAVLLIVKSYERDRILDWFEGLSEFNKAWIGAGIALLYALCVAWLTAPWINPSLIHLI